MNKLLCQRCPWCKKLLPGLKRLREHAAAFHSQPGDHPSIEEIARNLRDARCAVCGEGVKLDLDAVYRHFGRKHNLRPKMGDLTNKGYLLLEGSVKKLDNPQEKVLNIKKELGESQKREVRYPLFKSICQWCGLDFTSREKLLSHAKMSHGAAALHHLLGEQNTGNARTFPCPMCKTTMTLDYEKLSVHVKSMHQVEIDWYLNLFYEDIEKVVKPQREAVVKSETDRNRVIDYTAKGRPNFLAKRMCGGTYKKSEFPAVMVKCPFCPLYIDSAARALKHSRIIHGKDKDDPHLKSILSMSKKSSHPHQCRLCGNSISRFYDNIRRHLQRACQQNSTADKMHVTTYLKRFYRDIEMKLEESHEAMGNKIPETTENPKRLNHQDFKEERRSSRIPPSTHTRYDPSGSAKRPDIQKFRVGCHLPAPAANGFLGTSYPLVVVKCPYCDRHAHSLPTALKHAWKKHGKGRNDPGMGAIMILKQKARSGHNCQLCGTTIRRFYDNIRSHLGRDCAGNKSRMGSRRYLEQYYHVIKRESQQPSLIKIRKSFSPDRDSQADEPINNKEGVLNTAPSPPDIETTINPCRALNNKIVSETKSRLSKVTKNRLSKVTKKISAKRPFALAMAQCPFCHGYADSASRMLKHASREHGKGKDHPMLKEFLKLRQNSKKIHSCRICGKAAWRFYDPLRNHLAKGCLKNRSPNQKISIAKYLERYYHDLKRDVIEHSDVKAEKLANEEEMISPSEETSVHDKNVSKTEVDHNDNAFITKAESTKGDEDKIDYSELSDDFDAGSDVDETQEAINKECRSRSDSGFGSEAAHTSTSTESSQSSRNKTLSVMEVAKPNIKVEMITIDGDDEEDCNNNNETLEAFDGCTYFCPCCTHAKVRFGSLQALTDHVKARHHGQQLLGLGDTRVDTRYVACRMCGQEVVHDRIELSHHVWTEHKMSLEAYLLV